MVIDHLLGHDLGAVDHLFGGLLVALFPQEDVVVVATFAMGPAGLTGEVFAQDHIRLQRLERVHDDGQFVVIDLNGLNAV